MERYAVKEIMKEKNGQSYTFPIAVKSGNVIHDPKNPAIPVDGTLSETSKNPVENRIITKALKEKANVLTVNRIVYVAQGGSDTEGDGTMAKPYASISHALKNVPIINGNYEYTIRVEAGTYGGFTAKNVSATIELEGEVTIVSTGTYSIEIDDSNIKINGNDNTINLTGAASSALLYIHNGGRLNLYKTVMKLRGSGEGTGIYIVSDGGFSHTSGRISFDNLYNAIHVGTNSVFYSDDMYGNVTNGIIATAGGRVAYGSSTITATTPVQTSAGGRVYTGGQT